MATETKLREGYELAARTLADEFYKLGNVEKLRVLAHSLDMIIPIYYGNKSLFSDLYAEYRFSINSMLEKRHYEKSKMNAELTRNGSVYIMAEHIERRPSDFNWFLVMLSVCISDVFNPNDDLDGFYERLGGRPFEKALDSLVAYREIDTEIQRCLFNSISTQVALGCLTTKNQVENFVVIRNG